MKTRDATRRGGAWREARDLVVAQRGRLAVGFVLLVVNRLAGLVLPVTSKYLIDEVIGKGRAELIGALSLAAGAATLLQAVSSFVLARLLGVAAHRVITDLRKRVQAHVLRLSVSYYDATRTGELISRIMDDAEGVRNLVGTGIVQLAGGLFTSFLAVGVLFYLNWQLTLWISAILAVFGCGMAFAFRYIRPLFRVRHEINAEITGRLTESLGGVRTVKAYVAETREEEVFSAGVERYFRKVAQTITATSLTGALAVMVLGAVGVVMLQVGGRAILDGSMTLGDLVMYIFFTGLMAGPVVQIASIGTQITEALAGLDRIREILAVPEESAGRAGEPCGEVRGDVTFEEVHFEYQEGVPVLRGISFVAPAGTTTALVGSSGSGKSTLIGMVLAFRRPGSGRVLIDGRDLATLDLDEYRAHLGVVFQDNFLFDGTIGENISFSRPDATAGEIRDVARTAHADEFIERFDDGYETIVGERGVKLSGGQRQRIAIARALLARPRILILDEATSSLDSESEALIQDGLAALRSGRTTFVIAHRLSTIRAADQILVLEEGRIIERGAHAELLAAGGRYRELHDRQYRFEHERFVNPGEEHAGD